MKNKIILLLIILIAFTPCAFAIQDAKVISENKNQEDVQRDLNEINQYTNYLFTPSKKSTVGASKDYRNKEEEYTLDSVNRALNQHNTLPPVKKIRLLLIKQKLLQGDSVKFFSKKNKDKKVPDVVIAPTAQDQGILDCDFMEYYPEKTELEANGNVVMFFPQNNSSIKADRMVYNQTSNIIKAFGHVVLMNNGNEMFGDYMQINMNEENAIMDEPVTDFLQVHAKAKKGYMYGDKLIQEQGSMYVTKKTMVDVRAEMFGPDLDTMFVEQKDKGYYKKDSHGEKLKIKTNELIINSKKEHDTATLKHAELYFGERKIATIPTITVHTNKTQDYAEANFPEIGTVTNLGLYAGPGFVFDTPKGTTLKVIPILNYQSNGDNSSENSFGFGGIAKFKSGTNKTDMAYGTANKVFIMRGLQKLDDNLYFQYGSNGYMDDWFMGFRMPKMLGELVYNESFPFQDFLGKNRGMNFMHRISGAYVQDGGSTTPLFDSEGGIGTMRFKYMSEIAQTLYSFGNITESPINARLELVGQGSAGIYGTGDTQMIARIGPRIHTQYKSWMQDAGYFLSGYQDNTPLSFDRYMYGRSNVYLRESFRICKYLTVSWLGSLNLSQDSWDGKMMQENTFFFAIGPDDIKLNIGYDTIRQQSFVTMTMHLDAKGSTVEYKKLVIKNPDTLGKKEGAADSSGQSFTNASDDASTGVERAEVINMEGTL